VGIAPPPRASAIVIPCCPTSDKKIAVGNLSNGRFDVWLPEEGDYPNFSARDDYHRAGPIRHAARLPARLPLPGNAPAPVVPPA